MDWRSSVILYNRACKSLLLLISLEEEKECHTSKNNGSFVANVLVLFIFLEILGIGYTKAISLSRLAASSLTFVEDAHFCAHCMPSH